MVLFEGDRISPIRFVRLQARFPKLWATCHICSSSTSRATDLEVRHFDLMPRVVVQVTMRSFSSATEPHTGSHRALADVQAQSPTLWAT